MIPVPFQIPTHSTFFIIHEKSRYKCLGYKNDRKQKVKAERERKDRQGREEVGLKSESTDLSSTPYPHSYPHPSSVPARNGCKCEREWLWV